MDNDRYEYEDRNASYGGNAVRETARKSSWFSLIFGIAGFFVFGIPLGAVALVGGLFAITRPDENKVVAVLAILAGAFDIIAVIIALGI